MFLLSSALLCLFLLLSLDASATVSSSAAYHTISITVALKQQGIIDAAQELYRLADPSSTSYGLYWTPSKVARFFAPASDSTEEVLAWLAAIGVPRDQVQRSHQGHELTFSVPRSAVNDIFPLFSHTTTTRSIPVPPGVRDHVDFIIYSIPTPLVLSQIQPRLRHQTFAAPDVSTFTSPIRAEEDEETLCHTQSTPACLRRLYRIPVGNASHPRNSLGIFLPAWMTWLPQDLDAFFRKFQPGSVGRRPLISAINGGYRQFDSQIDPFNLEANLDFEYAIALTHPLPVTNIQVGERDLPGPQIGTMLAAFDQYYCGSLNSSIDAIPPTGIEGVECGTVTPPNVLSISFAWPETDYPNEYLERQCLEFLKLGLQGTTVIVATGDAGVASHPDGFCIDPVTGASNSTSSGDFIPSWPATCPWVTAVGGTAQAEDRVVAWRNLPSAFPPRGNVSEVAFRRVLNNKTRSSAGGFSRVFTLPDYQKQAVGAYLAAESGHLDAFLTRFNRSGRAYPDVAAIATGYQVVTSGRFRVVHGTSASAPVVASIISKINDARLHAGKRPVGFINPVLYRHPQALNDITWGASAGCGVGEAFPATNGWDAVTGLGTPDYERLLKVFMALP